MKKILVVSFLIMFAVVSVFAQAKFTAKTGDSELDVELSNINVKAKKDLPLFKKELSINFGIGEGKLNELMVSFKMQPADLFMTLQIAKLLTRPVDDVALSFKKNNGKGWGVIAKEMGIKPGSPEFHALKGSAKDKNGKMKGNKSNGGKMKGNKGNGKGKGNKKG